MPLERIREFNEEWHGDGEIPTWRAFIEHMALVKDADPSFPILLSETGGVMDGMHRVAKAVLEGRKDIEAVQCQQDPESDHLGRGPSDLPY